MGVTGLLPQLKPIQNPVTLHRYEGCTLAVDGYAWLHRAAHGCCEQLCLGEPTTRYLSFLIKKIDLLKRQHKITPFLVFDGDRLDAKAGTELKRRVRREENRKLGCELHKRGEKKKAWEYFQKSVDVTPEMAKCWIDYLQTHGLPFVVAPFEADAQMVYLEKQGFVDGIISEDSDLLVFGCKRLITKLKDNGECIEICRNDFEKLPRKFPLYELNIEEFQTLVCLSGCDYTDGISRVGLNKAMDFVKKYKTMDKILLAIQRDGKYEVPKDFMDEYKRATICFQYQRVFCPKLQKLVTLNELPESPLEINSKFFEYIGYGISAETGLKEYLSDLQMIDHNAHYLISIGEKSPGNHKRDLISREIKVTQSFTNVISTTTTSASAGDEPGDSTSQATNNPARRSITIDSFFLRSRDTLSKGTLLTSEHIASKQEDEKKNTNNQMVANTVNNGNGNLQNMMEKRAALLQNRSKSGVSSLSIKQQLNNVIIDKRKLVPKTGISSNSKFFCGKNKESKSTELGSQGNHEKSAENYKEQKIEVKAVIEKNAVLTDGFKFEIPNKDSTLKSKKLVNQDKNTIERFGKNIGQAGQDAESDGSEDISFDVSKELEEVEVGNDKHLLSVISSSNNASTDTFDDLNEGSEKTFVFNDDEDPILDSKEEPQGVLKSRTSRRNANVMGFPYSGQHNNTDEQFSKKNNDSTENSQIKRSLIFSQFAYSSNLRNSSNSNVSSKTTGSHGRIGIKRVLRPKNPNIFISNNTLVKHDSASKYSDTKQYDDMGHSKKPKTNSPNMHSLQEKPAVRASLSTPVDPVTSEKIVSSFGTIPFRIGESLCNDEASLSRRQLSGANFNRRQLFRSNTTSPIKSTASQKIPSLSRFIYKE
ncbi:hypothetical protein ACO0QE_000654 [Hanseniaspora vineae]